MAGPVEHLYVRSPVWAQQIMVGAYGWWWYKRRFSSDFDRLVREFKTREYWDAEQFRAYQEQRLNKILATAWESPYYRNLFTDAGVCYDTNGFDALAVVPPLSKEVLRARARD